MIKFDKVIKSLIVNFFCKKATSQIFGRVKNRLCLRFSNIELTLVPSLQIKPRKYSVTLLLKRRKVGVGK